MPEMHEFNKSSDLYQNPVRHDIKIFARPRPVMPSWYELWKWPNYIRHLKYHDDYQYWKLCQAISCIEVMGRTEFKAFLLPDMGSGPRVLVRFGEGEE